MLITFGMDNNNNITKIIKWSHAISSKRDVKFLLAIIFYFFILFSIIILAAHNYQ